MALLETKVWLDEGFSVSGHQDLVAATDCGSLHVNVMGGKVTFVGPRHLLERLVADLSRVLKDARR